MDERKQQIADTILDLVTRLNTAMQDAAGKNLVVDIEAHKVCVLGYGSYDRIDVEILEKYKITAGRDNVEVAAS